MIKGSNNKNPILKLDFDGPDLIPITGEDGDYDEEELHYWQNPLTHIYIQYELFTDEDPNSDSIFHRLKFIRETMEQSRYKYTHD